VAASSGGALTILQDFTDYLVSKDTGVDWVLFVSSDVISSSVPWVHIMHTPWPKWSIVARFLWEMVGARLAVERAGVDGILSMQNMTVVGCSLPQVVYVHQSLPFATWMHWSVWRWSETELALRARVQKPLILHSVRVAQRTIVQTQWMKKAVAEATHVSTERIVVVRPAIGGRIANSSCGISGYTGSIPDFFLPAAPVKYKDHESLLRAVRILQDEGIPRTVLLTIKGNENSCARHIAVEAKALGGAVILAGQLPREQILGLYSRSILVFPSRLETFGLPLLEARQAGGWIVASDTPFAREILEGYSRVVFSRPCSPRNLAESMQVAWHSSRDDRPWHPIESDHQDVSGVAGGWGDVVSLVTSVVRTAKLSASSEKGRLLR
jgi:glycosyltransferase involved in cell wall biosynthesis